MSITINQSPATRSPAYNDLVYVITSTNKAQANFKYIADIDIYGVGVVARLKNIPDPIYGSGVFNVSRILENYVTSDISTSSYGFQQNLNTYQRVFIQFGEEYGPSSGTTIYPNVQSSSSLFAWNSIFDFLPFTTYDQSNYILVSGSTKPFLTNAPLSQGIRDTENSWLHYMTTSSGTVFYAEVKTYDSLGANIQTVRVANPYQAWTSDNDGFARFGCGTKNLNLINSSGIITGAQPIIDSETVRYTVQTIKYNGSATSELRTFNINNACTQNTTYRFHFLNKLGGYDSFTFIRGSKKKVSITRSNYKKVNGSLQSASSFSYSASDRGTTQFDTLLKDDYRVLSDWIDEPTMIWLEELVTSPQVYLDDPTYGLVAVNIKNSSYDIKQTVQDKLFNLELEFEFSFDRYRQRG